MEARLPAPALQSALPVACPASQCASSVRSDSDCGSNSGSTASIPTTAPVSHASTLPSTNSVASARSSSSNNIILSSEQPTKLEGEGMHSLGPQSCLSIRDPETTEGPSQASADLSTYYSFSKRNSRVSPEDSNGLSGFLEYRKLNGTWRPFLFQTIEYQLVLYRVHSTHQVLVMSTDIRSATEISLHIEGPTDAEETRLLRLGINGTVITLRAVTHKAAVYWVEGLQRLKDGKPLQIVREPACVESEDDIFQEIDKLTSMRELAPLAPSAPLCGLCIPLTKPKTPGAGMLLTPEQKHKSLDDTTLKESTGCRIS